MMQEIFTWIAYFAPPLFVVLITLYVFRPSAKQDYEDAGRVIFSEDQSLEPVRVSKPRDHSFKA